jgi:adenosylcobinamide amidohydrolase
MQVLSWSINRPGFAESDCILWREVKNKDLSPEIDVRDWAREHLQGIGSEDAVLMLTSRDITCFETSCANVGAVSADAVVTIGLSNAERVGRRVDYSGRNWGTINVGVRLNRGLNQAGLLEAMSIAVQARTAAVMDANFNIPTGVATGTGTDCVTVAAPKGELTYTGLHTDVGEAVGRAVYDAVFAGAQRWINETEERRRARA